MGEIRVADAEREKAVQVANAHKLREIGTREATREQAVRVAELDKEQQVGEQSAAFQKQRQVKDAEREMRIKLADADARAVEGENLARADVVASQAALQVKKAKAYQVGETRKVQAEAAVLEAKHIARAKAALAKAQRIEAERRAAFGGPGQGRQGQDRGRGRRQGRQAADRGRRRGRRHLRPARRRSPRPVRDPFQKRPGTPPDHRRLRRHPPHSNCSCSNTSTISWRPRPRPSRTSSSTRLWSGRAARPPDKALQANWLHNMARTLPPMMQVMRNIGGVEIPETLASFAGLRENPLSDGHPSGDAALKPAAQGHAEK